MRKKKTNGSGQGQEAARLPGGAGLNIEKRLSYRFSILSDRMIRAVADMYGPRFGLLLSGWKAMATIGRYSRVSAKDVCAHTTVAPDKITRAVDRLVGLGFVERRRDETDGRRVALSLTPQGSTGLCGDRARDAGTRVVAPVHAIRRRARCPGQDLGQAGITGKNDSFRTRRLAPFRGAWGADGRTPREQREPSTKESRWIVAQGRNCPKRITLNH